MMQSPLSLKDISVSYAGKTAIHDVNIALNPGEIFGLMGLNGAGKTTMIKAVLGLRDQDSGEISIFGQHKLSRESKRVLSYLPEKFEPPWFLTGMEFLRFSLKLYKQPFIEDEMVSVAESLALDSDALYRRMSTYSKGMRQKLGLIATIFTGCSLFILDEPMSGLDPLARSLVKKVIVQMKNDRRTFFLSSHILSDMDAICDRVALLHKGSISYLGTPQDLKKKGNSDDLEQAFLNFIER